jgi:hypothetical protein
MTAYFLSDRLETNPDQEQLDRVPFAKHLE